MHAFALPRVVVCSFFSFACLFIPSICINTCPLPSFSSSSFPFFKFFFFLKVDPELLSVYHPTSREFLATMGMPIEGFFNVADIVVEAMASAFVAEHGAPVEVSIHPPKPILVEEST